MRLGRDLWGNTENFNQGGLCKSSYSIWNHLDPLGPSSWRHASQLPVQVYNCTHDRPKLYGDSIQFDSIRFLYILCLLQQRFLKDRSMTPEHMGGLSRTWFIGGSPSYLSHCRATREEGFVRRGIKNNGAGSHIRVSTGPKWTNWCDFRTAKPDSDSGSEFIS